VTVADRVVTSQAESSRRWPALALLCVAQFVDVLDVNAVVIALPTIGRELGFGRESLQWVVTAYVLVFGGFLLLAGRLADLYGRRRMFATGLVVFTAASLLCGLAASPMTLVAARAVQGLGAAIVAPAALAIIATLFPEGRERGFAMGLWTAVAASGGAAGLLLGGLLTDALGWRSVFFVNVPVGALSILLIPVLLAPDAVSSRNGRIDLPGALTVTAGLAFLVFGLTQAEEEGFRSPLTLGPVAIAVALLGAFLVIERNVADPLVPLHVFRIRDLSGSALVAFTNTATTSPVAVLAVLYLQEVLSYSPTESGMLGLPLSFAVVAGSFLGARLMRAVGGRRTMVLGLLGIGAGSLLISGISADRGLGFVVANAVLAGLGLGCAAVASTTIGTSAVRAEDRGLAAGLLNSAAQVGTAVGLATLFAVAMARADAVAAGGQVTTDTLVAGYRWAFLVAAGMAALGAWLTLALVQRDNVSS
jgi:EmrB/QacA subfamily drug resistance transporter